MLDTRGLAPGGYALHESATGDPTDHTLGFTLK